MIGTRKPLRTGYLAPYRNKDGEYQYDKSIEIPKEYWVMGNPNMFRTVRFEGNVVTVNNEYEYAWTKVHPKVLLENMVIQKSYI
jgi:hypothetical protein